MPAYGAILLLVRILFFLPVLRSYAVTRLPNIALDIDRLGHQSIETDDIISNSKHIEEHSHLESPSSL